MADKVYHAVGKRKNAIARVYMKEGSGKFNINDREYAEYFPREIGRQVLEQPLAVTNMGGKFDFYVNVVGGGITGQAEATRLGIARSLIAFDPALRAALRKAGLITRDSREVERKKYGQSGARKRYQFSKR